MCNFDFSIEVSKEEIENLMFVRGEYVIRDGKYYIPNVPGFRDGYICPCFYALTDLKVAWPSGLRRSVATRSFVGSNPTAPSRI